MGLQKLGLQCHFNNMKLVMKRLKTTKQNVTEVQLQETSHDKLHEYNDSKDSYSYH